MDGAIESIKINNKLTYKVIGNKKPKGICGSGLIDLITELFNNKMSKAAIYAGFYTLLQTLNINLKDIHKFFIAGNFGNFINTENAIKIGLLPKISQEKFTFLGKGALKGASMILYNKQLAEEIAKKAEYLDLHRSNVFMDEYQKAIFLPHTELERFG